MRRILVVCGLALAGPAFAVSSYVGIGTTAPNAPLSVTQNVSPLPAPPASTIMQIANADGLVTKYLSDSFGTYNGIIFRRADGTAASPSSLLQNEAIGNIGWWGYGGGYSIGALAQISGATDQNWSSSAQGTFLSFSTTPNGSTTIKEAMRINNAGNVGIGTTSPLGNLDVENGSNTAQLCLNGSCSTTLSGSSGNLHTSAITSGTSWTSPSSITTSTVFKFTLIGGGGGGAGSGSGGLGTGGGGGGTVIWSVSGLSPNTAYGITIGAGGSGGGSNGNGTAGTSTTLTIGGTTVTAGGGGAGTYNVTNVGGAGGTATGGTINIPGGKGYAGINIGSQSWDVGGAGGSSLLGFGAPFPYLANVSGGSGSGYGAGGSGAYSNSGAVTGGAGTQGIIVVEAIY